VLAADWVTPGLQAMVPSVRVGPVLVDPAEIRLPKVASLGKDQLFTRRTGPLTWRVWMNKTKNKQHLETKQSERWNM